MTITPIPGLPAPAAPEGRSGGTDAGSSSAAGGFAAFLAGLLAPAGGPGVEGQSAQNTGQPGDLLDGAVAAPVAAPVDDSIQESGDTADDSGADPAAVAADALAALLGGTVAVSIAPAAVAGTGGPSSPVSADPSSGPDVDAAATPSADLSTASAGTPDRPEAAEQLPAASTTAPGAAGTAAEEAATLTVRTAGADRRLVGTDDRIPTQPRAAGVDVIASSAPATAPAAGASPAPTTGAGASMPAMPVLEQLSPGIARLVSRGDGEHRMSLVLHPADLGEVRVTVTVRGEHVDVEIAAGTHARDLLRDGSAQLRHLLETTGRVAGAVTFRDLAASAVPLAAATSDGSAGSGQTDARPGWGEPGQGGHAAGDPAGGEGFARGRGHGPDSGTDLPGRTAGTTRPGVEPLPRTRTAHAGTAGLDLTI